MFRLIQQKQGAITPSIALTTYTNETIMFLSPVGPSNPMHWEVVRTATSMLCKEMLQPGKSTGLGLREMEEVEVRLRALAQLERVWGESTYGISGSATQLDASATMRDRDAGDSAPWEKREQRFFAEALRDGYVLCQWVSAGTSFAFVTTCSGGGTLTQFFPSLFFCSSSDL
jgi:hypothetical protein